MSYERNRLIKAAERAKARYERRTVNRQQAFLFWYRIEKLAHPGIYARRSTWNRHGDAIESG